MSAYARERALERLPQLARQGLDLVSFWREAQAVLAPAVPHWLGPCWYTLDPASLLMTSHFNDAVVELDPEALVAEYRGDDVNGLADVARSPRGVSTLHEATGGDPSSSPRWHANMELGGDQELIAALRAPDGAVWGAVGLYREPGQPLFSGEEIECVRTAAPALADGARRALLLGEAYDGEGPEAPGLVVVDARGDVESSTPGVEAWVDELGGDWAAGRLGPALLSVAARALAPDGAEQASARVRAASGTWVVVHGTPLAGAGPGKAAVIVEPAHPARIVPLLMAAYGLSNREQEVTRLVLRGESTAGIAERLVVSPHTVQQHLKSIFEKTGVRSRRDLVGKVFFGFYEPRVRDNEGRASEQRPLRGGPLAPG
jgi:DNA-binding CsgD family transcriptional regulator